MGKITRHGGATSTRTVSQKAVKTAADELRERGKLGPYGDAAAEPEPAPEPAAESDEVPAAEPETSPAPDEGDTSTEPARPRSRTRRKS